MPITDYNDVSITPLILGQVAYSDLEAMWYTGYNAGNVIIPCGFGVVKGTGNPHPTPCVLPVDANSIFMGVALWAPIREKRSGYSVDADNRYGIPLQHEFGYLKRGVVAVLVDGPVSAQSTAVFVRHTASGAQRKGVFRADADTNTALAVPSARWIDTVAAATPAAPVIARLSLNLD